ncbi:MAG: hypothetical protein NWE93_07590 [Candidatus Bathyarchaeota archaeon]|nr:hypothetical protein [Candidatus Bathyarchaeota archaeon]
MGNLTPENLEKLSKLNKNIKTLISQEPELDNILCLNSKLNGVFGEAIGLAKLYEIYKSDACYEWEGKQKKGYDIQISKNGKKTRFQIKMSVAEEFVFRVIKVANLNADKIRGECEIPIFDEIGGAIRKAIDEAETDVWLLIHNKKDEPKFYWINKEDMAKIVIEHYKNAVINRNHIGKNYHQYIEKDNVYRPHIIQREDGKLLEECNKIGQVRASS